ncbi:MULTISPECIES: PhzF family phenazine biosynthesis protein [unclassified Kocuria]|uniref:PhzF family phenazine biosynthesis protein n=1 Tax=unclassified Kocuria TaxID=2649579 RepID=UPI000F891E25|nr:MULTISPECIES: PhzF family phenazine biosynthesis protein [unclassified Kocuria]MDN5631300.1 PhzF family phenazine biosynthesis protein [Kocuria sp.]RUP84415.1 PhzF family phenazine biosynthesis protein [Kocuria sp. HSID17590]RUQ11836.1 PhzF family phenazine biosynthesis protein [Kocuria sp. HSID17582]
MTSLPRSRPFAQVDVFSADPYLGNPVAVVLDGSDLTDEQMARFARWTNLSETTFVLPATTTDADYRLRIWTPHGELPFAGHPTLGSARAWLRAGNDPRVAGTLVQECAAGLVRIHAPSSGSSEDDDAALSFEAPPTVRSGDLEDDVLRTIVEGLGITARDVLAHQWVDNGPGWAAVVLDSADKVLALDPDVAALGAHKVGVVGPAPEGSAHRFEVRAFVPGARGYEDPVTGSLNASLAQWLIRTDRTPREYVARQGTRLGRRGLVHVSSLGEDVLVGGACTVCVSGSVLL